MNQTINPNTPPVLVACEESGVVAQAFIARGIPAISCDTAPTSNRLHHNHIQCDVREILNQKWSAIIAFPPCTHLSSSGARWFAQKRKDGRQDAAIQFFLEITKCTCEHLAIENPIGIMSTKWRKPDQIIQPWMFGHGETKATCLWLRNLPPLLPTKIVKGRESRIHKMPPSPERARIRSITYTGIAEAMASQWGDCLHK